MKRLYASVWIFVCLFAVTARAQDAGSAAASKNVIFDIKIVDTNTQTPEELEAIAKDPNRLNQMLSEGKAKLIAGTKTYCVVNEQTNVRTGQRVPVQTATLPTYQPPRLSNLTNQAPQQPSEGQHIAVGIPQIQYENTGLNLTLEPRLKKDGTTDLVMRIELTMLTTDTGRLTPTFLTRNFMGVIKLKYDQSPMIIEMFQNEVPGQSSAQTNPVNAMRGSFFILLSAKIAD